MNTVGDNLEQAFVKSPGLDYIETYVFIMAGLTMVWIVFTNCHWAIRYYCCTKKTEENIHLTLLKDDLIKAAPFKKNPKGEVNFESLIKLHGVAYKHAQKKIMNRELDVYQPARVKALKENDMTAYKQVVRKGSINSEVLTEYVRKSACKLLKITDE